MTPAPKASGKRILVVEDEHPLAHALELKLTHEGFAVTVAPTGLDGLKQAEEGKFDLILLDVILPEMDGFTILQTLKENGSKTPVIVLSNLGQEEDRAKAKECGAVNYLVKSNSPLADIVRVVKETLAKS